MAPRLLDENDIDQIAESLDNEMTAVEEEDAFARVSFSGQAGDLSDGGRVGGVTLHPMSGQGGKRIEVGRAAARRAWMWDGTESLLPLAWNPEGTRHDGARHYLLKRHCLCCGASGFTGLCKACVNSTCQHCRGGSIPEKIIPNFYLRKNQVPYPVRFFGDIPCFLPFCPRQGTQGFKTPEDMRIHARTRHRMEYQAHMDTMAANRSDEVDVLRARLDRMMGGAPEPLPEPTPEPKKRRPMDLTFEQRQARADHMRRVTANRKAEQEARNHPLES